MNVKLYVGNLSWGTTDASLKSLFEQAGTVTEARIIIDRETRRSRGFGFVSYATQEEADKAISMFNEQDFDGRKLVVNIAREEERRDGGSRGGYEGRDRR
jgi:RNA recognition motif-containing protein